MATKLEVPYSRPITLGVVGEDVKGYKRAVSRAAPDLYPWIPPEKGGFTPLAGKYFVEAVGRLQHRAGIPQTNTIGPLVHNWLEGAARKGHPTEHAFDALAIQYLTDFYNATHVSPNTRIRQNGLHAMQYWYSMRMNTAYSQARPFPVLKPPAYPRRIDCSGFATNVHYAAGAPNPNRRAWDGQGYTGTLMNGGVRCAFQDLEILDLIFYGFSTRGTDAFPYGSPTHVAVYAGDGMVYSMGSYPMGYYRYNYRTINHMRHYDVTP